MNLIGVDIGSSKIVIQKMNSTGVEAILSLSSARFLPNILSFSSNERYICDESAVQKLKSNYQNTIQCPFRCLRDEEINFQNYLIFEEQNLQVEYYGKQNIHLVQLQGMIFNYIKKIIDLTIQNYQVCITYPDYFTQSEKNFYEQSLNISNLPVLTLVPESNAISLSHYFFNIQNQSQQVLFIDIGHGKSNVFLTNYNEERIEIKKITSDPFLGTKLIDQKVLEFLTLEIQTQNRKINQKQKLRLLEQIERQRKVLSTNTDVIFNIDFSDMDLEIKFTRQNLNDLIDILGFQCFFEKIKSEFVEIQSIQLIGGGTRIPYIQDLIQTSFLDVPILRNLNSEECIAQGAALLNAKISRNWKRVDIPMVTPKQAPSDEIQYQNFKKEQIIQFKQQEMDWIQRDFDLEKCITMKNTLESFIYENQQNLQDQYRPFMEDNQIEVLSQVLKSGREWLENNQNSTLDQIKNQYNFINEISYKILTVALLKLKVNKSQIIKINNLRDLKKLKFQCVDCLEINISRQEVTDGDGLMSFLLKGLKQYLESLQEIQVTTKLSLLLGNNEFSDNMTSNIKNAILFQEQIQWLQMDLSNTKNFQLNSIKEIIKIIPKLNNLKIFQIKCNHVDKDFLLFLKQQLASSKSLREVNIFDENPIHSETLRFFQDKFIQQDIIFKYIKI